MKRNLLKSKFSIRVFALIMVLTMILPTGVSVYAETAPVYDLYASPNGITVKFSSAQESVAANIDGVALSQKSVNEDKTEYVFSAKLDYDKWYALSLSVNGQQYVKAIRLKTLLLDNFNEDAAGWDFGWDSPAGYDAERKSLILPKAANSNPPKCFYGARNVFGADQQAWTDYRIDIKLANEVNTNHFKLHVDAYKQDPRASKDGKGVGFGIIDYSDNSTITNNIYRWFENVYKVSSHDMNAANNSMYSITDQNAASPIDKADEYLNYIGYNAPYRKNKDDVISFCVSKNSQALLLDDSIRKVTAIDAENDAGGFVIYNRSRTDDIYVKEIAVYKLETIDGIVMDAVATKSNDGVEISYTLKNFDTETAKGVQVIAAAYKGDRLIGSKVCNPVDINSKQEIKSSISMASISGVDMVKVFVWENINNSWSMKPLTPCYEKLF